MGMLECSLHKIPDNMTKDKAMQAVKSWVSDKEDDSDMRPENVDISILTEEKFEEAWELQETYHKTPEIKEKYRALAKEGKLIYVEIDW